MTFDWTIDRSISRHQQDQLRILKNCSVRKFPGVVSSSVFSFILWRYDSQQLVCTVRLNAFFINANANVSRQQLSPQPIKNESATNYHHHHHHHQNHNHPKYIIIKLNHHLTFVRVVLEFWASITTTTDHHLVLLLQNIHTFGLLDQSIDWFS